MKKLFIVLALFLALFLFQNSLNSQVKVGAHLGFALPMGDFGDVVSSGFGAMGSLNYKLNSDLTLTVGLGYYSFGKKDENKISGLGYSTDYSYSILPIVGGLKYELGKDKGSIVPYVGGELGFYHISFSFKTTVLAASVETEDSETNFGFSPLAGVVIKLNKDLDFDLNLKYTILSSTGIDPNHLVLNAGIIFSI